MVATSLKCTDLLERACLVINNVILFRHLSRNLVFPPESKFFLKSAMHRSGSELVRLTRTAASIVKPSRCQLEARRYLPYCSKEEKSAEATRLKENKCKNKLCKPPPPPPKPGFWRRFFSCEDDGPPKPPLTTCRKRLAHKKHETPDLSFIDGQPFKTCGEAYIVQKDLLPVKPSETSRELRLIKKIEQPLYCLLDATEDPMDKITKSELRLIALHDKKLHPSYKQLDTIPKQIPACCPAHAAEPPRVYNTICGPLDPNDIPIQLKFNKDLLDKKNIMYDFKRVEPPRDLVAPIIEMRKNQRPTLEKRRRFDVDQQVGQTVDRRMESMTTKKCSICFTTKAASYDTLQQTTTLLDSMLHMGRQDNKAQDAKAEVTKKPKK